MIVCPACFHEVPPGLSSCVHCGEDIDAAEPVVVTEPGSWRIVRTVSTEMEARILAGRLLANGVPACVLSQVDSTRGFTVGALAIAKVFVQAHRFDDAVAILARDESLSVDDLPPDDRPHDDTDGESR